VAQNLILRERGLPGRKAAQRIRRTPPGPSARRVRVGFDLLGPFAALRVAAPRPSFGGESGSPVSRTRQSGCCCGHPASGADVVPARMLACRPLARFQRPCAMRGQPGAQAGLMSRVSPAPIRRARTGRGPRRRFKTRVQTLGCHCGKVKKTAERNVADETGTGPGRRLEWNRQM
jgi:hypothetical protein